MSGPNSSSDEHRQRIRESAAWAAFGDALGFITELVDRNGVERRVGTRHIRTTVPWRRRIGGQFGPTIELPAGAISDDTQLRLATSRSIRPSGAFDVETFASIELTVWPAYALGAGRGSLAAAAALRKRDVTWASNFFKTRDTNYLNGGGNGAAMRIQPHVWAHDPVGQPWGWLPDVLVNAIVTHGHARGFVGAVFHAACLDVALKKQRIPNPDDWAQIVRQIERVVDIAYSDDRLGELWLRQWEKLSEQSLNNAVQDVAIELFDDLTKCSRLDPHNPRASYATAVEALRAYDPAQRGSATKTAVLAAVAAHLFADRSEEGIIATADYVGTDTDSIATMQGAIVGAAGGLGMPAHSIQDLGYVLGEADRMWAAAERQKTSRFPYPDILSWRAPRSATDALGSLDREPYLAGLGPVELGDGPYETHGRATARWQWVQLWFGQTVLAKRRPRPTSLVDSQVVQPTAHYVQDQLRLDGAPPSATSYDDRQKDAAPPARRPDSEHRTAHTQGGQDSLIPHGQREPEPTVATVDADLDRLSLDELTNYVIRSGFSDTAIGAGLRAIAIREHAIEDSIAYTSIIMKALVARGRRHRAN